MQGAAESTDGCSTSFSPQCSSPRKRAGHGGQSNEAAHLGSAALDGMEAGQLIKDPDVLLAGEGASATNRRASLVKAMSFIQSKRPDPMVVSFKVRTRAPGACSLTLQYMPAARLAACPLRTACHACALPANEQCAALILPALHALHSQQRRPCCCAPSATCPCMQQYAHALPASSAAAGA